MSIATPAANLPQQDAKPSARTRPRRDLPTPQARVARAHQARLAELFASRSEVALAAGNRQAALRWQREYDRCAKRCRGLGEILRADSDRPNYYKSS